jgi:hypothetical protein
MSGASRDSCAASNVTALTTKGITRRLAAIRSGACHGRYRAVSRCACAARAGASGLTIYLRSTGWRQRAAKTELLSWTLHSRRLPQRSSVASSPHALLRLRNPPGWGAGQASRPSATWPGRRRAWRPASAGVPPPAWHASLIAGRRPRLLAHELPTRACARPRVRLQGARRCDNASLSHRTGSGRTRPSGRAGCAARGRAGRHRCIRHRDGW